MCPMPRMSVDIIDFAAAAAWMCTCKVEAERRRRRGVTLVEHRLVLEMMEARHVKRGPRKMMWNQSSVLVKSTLACI